MPRLLSSFGVGLLTFLLAYGVWAEERVVHFYQVNAASIMASATFGHSASPDSVTCWYIMVCNEP